MVLFFFFEGVGDRRDLHVLTHSFPTRRSSDVSEWPSPPKLPTGSWGSTAPVPPVGAAAGSCRLAPSATSMPAGRWSSRSEEHTSELQSLMRISYAVFCLKKKKKIKVSTHYSHT